MRDLSKQSEAEREMAGAASFPEMMAYFLVNEVRGFIYLHNIAPTEADRNGVVELFQSFVDNVKDKYPILAEQLAEAFKSQTAETTGLTN